MLVSPNFDENVVGIKTSTFKVFKVLTKESRNYHAMQMNLVKQTLCNNALKNIDCLETITIFSADYETKNQR